MDRRSFLLRSAATAAAIQARHMLASGETPETATAAAAVQHETPFGSAGVMIPDTDWRMWPDRAASWQDDTIYLPEDVRLDQLPVNVPTGGWETLHDDQGVALTLPSTVEQFFWGAFGLRPYDGEYRFESVDKEVKNGSYTGVSWWWRELEIPAAWHGQRIFLHVRAARLRCEVLLNRRLVGYSILEDCLSPAS